mmetsp:Transcript_42077/g.91683  ORF Transcript_42077/g.91683 Transcript_42077/m.91683 type:complete len:80 (+) Transcript_42077:187-426(+)|eukprot:CAMPEP_0204270166 /NCGR_PEP_ID=MMETSP0468-20130131/18361_1 /ASSEMBLY_ACC=CAM_ASM_000383 /TAXON_ID=2969 /ORGANISM="Oxyrrhis marina" /LENGTH=79 /DNA_ID=CAMNT_0051245661 /DNA_START=171 /DNA_END=410 /DNA_ORIENTATION=+
MIGEPTKPSAPVAVASGQQEVWTAAALGVAVVALAYAVVPAMMPLGTCEEMNAGESTAELLSVAALTIAAVLRQQSRGP